MLEITSLSHNTGILVLTFIAGACIGSFLNVVGLRFLREESVVNPPSHCPNCKTALQFWENIPILSFILLRGCCRTCRQSISVQYPLIETFTGILFVLAVFLFGLGWQTLLLFFLIANLVVITITDWRESLIFEINSLGLIPAGILFSMFNLGHFPTIPDVFHFGHFSFSLPDTLISSFIAIIGSYLFFEIMILISQWAFGTEGFGHGDTHLMMGVSAFLGWKLTVMALILGFTAQSVFAIPLLFIQWIRQRDYLSLGSGLSAFSFAFLPFGIPAFHFSPVFQNVLFFLSAGLAILSLIVFLIRVRQRESHTYLPLGPALIVGSLVALFVGNALLQHLHLAFRY